MPSPSVGLEVMLNPGCLCPVGHPCASISGWARSAFHQARLSAPAIPASAWALNSPACPKKRRNAFRPTPTNRPPASAWLDLVAQKSLNSAEARSEEFLPLCFNLTTDHHNPHARILILIRVKSATTAYSSHRITEHLSGTPHEDWNYRISHLRRQRHRRHRTRPGTGAARPRNSLHLLRPAYSPARLLAQHPLPRSRSHPLSALRLPSVRSRARHPYGRGRAALRS